MDAHELARHIEHAVLSPQAGEEDLHAAVRAAVRWNVRAILETAYLEDWQKRLASRLAARAGAAYVKTSTGFAPKGATIEDVALMRRTVGDRLGVKAAGGIRTYAEAMALVRAGANLIGTSQTEAILTEAGRKAA